MGGRKPIPIELLDNKKNRLTKEEIEKRKNNTPGGCDDKLTPPKDLSPMAKKEWRRIVRLHSQLSVKVINDLDSQALKMYCIAKVNYDIAAMCYLKEGQHPTVKEFTKFGYKMVPNPLLKVMEQQTNLINGLSSKLCLDAMDRARRGMVQANEPKNPLNDFMNEYKDEE